MGIRLFLILFNSPLGMRGCLASIFPFVGPWRFSPKGIKLIPLILKVGGLIKLSLTKLISKRPKNKTCRNHKNYNNFKISFQFRRNYIELSKMIRNKCNKIS